MVPRERVYASDAERQAAYRDRVAGRAVAMERALAAANRRADEAERRADQAERDVARLSAELVAWKSTIAELE